METSQAGANAPADFTEFMRNYQDMVYSTSLRLVGTPAQAEDVAQEVFLKAWERWGELGRSPTAGGWLKTVATNLSLNHLQRYRRRWRFFSEYERKDAEEPDTPIEFAAPEVFFAGMEADERRDIVQGALARLPEHQRIPLVLFHFEEVPYEEIAGRLRVSLSKVKMDIHRGRAALAKMLSLREGGAS